MPAGQVSSKSFGSSKDCFADFKTLSPFDLGSVNSLIWNEMAIRRYFCYPSKATKLTARRPLSRPPLFPWSFKEPKTKAPMDIKMPRSTIDQHNEGRKHWHALTLLVKCGGACPGKPLKEVAPKRCLQKSSSQCKNRESAIAPFQSALVLTSRKLLKWSEGLERASRGRIVGLRSKAGMGWVMAKGGPQSSIGPNSKHQPAPSCQLPSSTIGTSKATTSFSGRLISLESAKI